MIKENRYDENKNLNKENTHIKDKNFKKIKRDKSWNYYTA